MAVEVSVKCPPTILPQGGCFHSNQAERCVIGKMKCENSIDDCPRIAVDALRCKPPTTDTHFQKAVAKKVAHPVAQSERDSERMNDVTE